MSLTKYEIEAIKFIGFDYDKFDGDDWAQHDAFIAGMKKSEDRVESENPEFNTF